MRVPEGPACESPPRRGRTRGLIPVSARRSKRRPERAAERVRVLAHACEAPRRAARSASQARRGGAARPALQPKCGVAGTLRQSGPLGEVSARVEDEGSSETLLAQHHAGPARREGPRRMEARVSAGIHAKRSSALGLPVGYFHDGGPRDGATRPTATREAHREQSDHQHRPERASHRPCLLVPRPTGRRSDFEAWLEVSVRGATDVPTRPSPGLLQRPENSIGCTTSWAGR